MAKMKKKKKLWKEKTKLKEKAQEIIKSQYRSGNKTQQERNKLVEQTVLSEEEQKYIECLKKVIERKIKNRNKLENEKWELKETIKLLKEHYENAEMIREIRNEYGNLLLEELKAYGRSLEKLRKLKVNVLKNENSKDKFILLENIELKIRKDEEHFDKEVEKAKELGTWAPQVIKEMYKIDEEEKLAERKEIIEKHINENIQYAKEYEKKVDKCFSKTMGT